MLQRQLTKKNSTVLQHKDLSKLSFESFWLSSVNTWPARSCKHLDAIPRSDFQKGSGSGFYHVLSDVLSWFVYEARHNTWIFGSLEAPTPPSQRPDSRAKYRNIEIPRSRNSFNSNTEISEIDRNRIETCSDLITQLPTHCPTSKPAKLCQALQRLKFSDRGTNEKTLQCLADLSQEDFTFSADKSWDVRTDGHAASQHGFGTWCDRRLSADGRHLSMAKTQLRKCISYCHII